VVFLDADAIVTRNMDKAFSCPGFCWTLVVLKYTSADVRKRPSPPCAAVFLDADTIVTRNMDKAFDCPGFC